MIMLAHAAADWHADVPLHGGGGDTLLGGPLPFAQLARRGHPLAAVAAAWRLRVPWQMSAMGRVRSLVISPLLPRAVVRRRRRRALGAAWMTHRSLSVARDVSSSFEYQRAQDLPDTPDAWMRSLVDDQEQADVADLGGQILASTGNAPIDAFMDFEFVRFMLQIDPVLLSHGHEYRGLYRLAMRGILPEPLRNRQDKARYEPAIAETMLGSDAFGALQDLSSLEELATRDLVDPRTFGPLFDEWFAAVRRGERVDPDPADERWEAVWQLLSVEAFLREHGRGRDLA